jgi:hypothetical protein
MTKYHRNASLRNPRPSEKHNSKGVRLRAWRVVLIRNRGDFLGYVEAATAEAVEPAAAKRFRFSEFHRIVRTRSRPSRTFNEEMPSSPHPTASPSMMQEVECSLRSASVST